LERVKRLLVPFYLIGFMVLIPPQYYWEQVTHGHFIGDFFQFIPNYFHFPTEPQLFGFYFGFHPTFLSYWPGHLWFLRYLFILSLITLPIMKYLKSESGRMLITKLAEFCYRRGGIFLFALPLALVQIVLRAAFPNYLSWADFAFWLVLFLIGYIIPSDDRFTQAIKLNSWISLIVGIFMFMLIVYLLNKSGYREALMIHPNYTAGYVVFQTISSLNTWCLIVFIFSLGVTFLNFNNNILSYCNEAVLPFYILHQTIILTVGFFVIQWNLNIMLKYIIISTSSFALIIIIYEFFIRRFNIIRFLFGMKHLENNPVP
jgi:glucans biosynthesis protein C